MGTKAGAHRSAERDEWTWAVSAILLNVAVAFFTFMHLISSILVALVATEHSLIMIAEMWFWRAPWVMERFKPKAGTAECPAVYAANQGLYNGFLAAGLFWSILTDANGFELKIFFLGCVIVAGIYGAVTVKPQILLLQAVPAGLALATTLLGR